MKALITGANSLVNKALLHKLVAMGYNVTAHYHSENDLTEEIKKRYPKVRFMQADFADKSSSQRFIEQAGNTKYDVLVNAAVYYAGDSSDWEEWQKSFAVNTTIPGMLMARADTLLNRGGVVINISSTYGQPYMASVRFSQYSASKAALDSLTMAFAKILSPDIRVVGIAPGWIKSAWNKNMSQQDMAGMIGPQLTHRFVEPEEIANLMETVIKNGSINATTLIIDGGLGAPKVR